MELLQLIFSVIAGLGAGAMGALIVARREEDADREQSVNERLQELEHQNAKNNDRIEQLGEFIASADRDLRSRLQASLVARDERIEAVHERIKQAERTFGKAPNPAPQQRLQVRLEDTAGRIEVVESAVSQLERRIQAKLIAFREGTQEVIRKLAEHQVEEAERVTQLSREAETAKARLEALGTLSGDSHSTTAALVEVMESQVALTQRSSELESRFTDGMREFARHMMDLETRLTSVDELQGRLQQLQSQVDDTSGSTTDPLQVRAALEPEADSTDASPPTDELEQIFGIGPKLAGRLRANDVPDIRALAALTEDDLQRLGRELKGFKDRQTRHDWVGQARRILEARGQSIPSVEDDDSATEPPAPASGSAAGQDADKPSPSRRDGTAPNGSGATPSNGDPSPGAREAPIEQSNLAGAVSDSMPPGDSAAKPPPQATTHASPGSEPAVESTVVPPPTAPPMWPVTPADPDAVR